MYASVERSINVDYNKSFPTRCQLNKCSNSSFHLFACYLWFWRAEQKKELSTSNRVILSWSTSLKNKNSKENKCTNPKLFPDLFLTYVLSSVISFLSFFLFFQYIKSYQIYFISYHILQARFVSFKVIYTYIYMIKYVY